MLALAFALVGCGPAPSPASVRSKKDILAPSDLAKKTPPQGTRAFQLRAFQIDHIWAGAGHGGDAAQRYRAKITVWDYNDESAIAELYFHDAAPDGPIPNPDETARPYRLHFPASVIGPAMSVLRNANEPVYLYYYDNQWAIGVASAEPVGVD